MELLYMPRMDGSLFQISVEKRHSSANDGRRPKSRRLNEQ